MFGLPYATPILIFVLQVACFFILCVNINIPLAPLATYTCHLHLLLTFVTYTHLRTPETLLCLHINNKVLLHTSENSPCIHYTPSNSFNNGTYQTDTTINCSSSSHTQSCIDDDATQITTTACAQKRKYVRCFFSLFWRHGRRRTRTLEALKKAMKEKCIH